MTALLDMTGMTGVTCKRKFPLLSSKGCPIVNIKIYFVEMVPATNLNYLFFHLSVINVLSLVNF